MKNILLLALSAALIAVLLGSYVDHAQLSTRLKAAQMRKERQTQMTATVQHKEVQDQSQAIQQLRTELGKMAATQNKIVKQSDATALKLGEKQQENLVLQQALDATKAKLSQATTEGDRCYVFYTKWKEFGLDQQEYAKGLYADDLLLRAKGKQAPYPPSTTISPDSLPRFTSELVSDRNDPTPEK